MSYSERIQAIMTAKGLSKAEFARLLDVPRSTLVGWLEGKSVSIGILKTLEEQLTVNIDWFLTGKGCMYQDALSLKSEHGLAKSEGFKVPLLRQKVSCGPGVNWEDEENISEYIDIFNMIPRIKITRQFALCVSGNSMIGAGIRDGDYVVFDGEYDQESRDGIYVFALDGEVYCKLLEFDMTKIKIFSVRFGDLDKSELMVTLDAKDMATSDRFTIFGKVLYWFHPNTWNN